MVPEKLTTNGFAYKFPDLASALRDIIRHTDK
jgi:NAD dependent epimerase/dehydratase family enzyme